MNRPYVKAADKSLPELRKLVAKELQLCVRLEAAAVGMQVAAVVDGEVTTIYSPQGYVICVTCGKQMDYRAAQGGHFVSRRHAPTLVDERNIHVQCVHCNHYLSGNMDAYRLYMIRRYGERVVRELEVARYRKVPLTKQELLELLPKIRGRVRAARKVLG